MVKEFAESYEKETRKQLVEDFKLPLVNPRRKAWGLQEELKGLDIPTIDQVVSRIVAASKFNIKHGAFLAMLYGTGSRIGEIMGTPSDMKYKLKPTSILYLGIHIKDIMPKTDASGSDWLYFRTQLEKKRKKDFRISYLCKDNKWDAQLMAIIDSYLEQEFKDPEKAAYQKVFQNLSYGRCRGIVLKYIGCNPHYLRDLRATHLGDSYGFTPADLKHYFKWSSESMAVRYSRSSENIILGKLKAQ